METKKLKECCTIIRGRADNNAHDNTTDNGIPFVRPVDFENLFPSPTKYTSQPIQIANKNDILMIIDGNNAGSVNFAQSKLAIGTGVIAIRPSSLLHPFYVFCFLKSIESKLSSMATGTALKQLRIDSIEDVDIALPTIAEQSQVAEHLMQSALKIESLKLEITKEEDKLNTIIKDTFK